MVHAPDLLHSLALAWSVAAVTSIVFQRLHLPVVLGYLLAGLVIGPYVPVPLVADPALVHGLAEVGVVLLMFGIGLDLSFRHLAKVLPRAGLVALIELSAMLAAGTLMGRLLGWDDRTSLYTGAVVAISSTTLVARSFEGMRIDPAVRGLVFGVLVVEDVAAVVLLTVFTQLGGGGRIDATLLAQTTGGLLAFLAVLVVAGVLMVPRTMRAVVRLGRPETTLMASIGLCFGLALLARTLGYSVALGGFLAGVLVAESGEAATVEPLVRPVKDALAAVFFVAVGMGIDPSAVVEHAGAVAALTAVVLVGKVLAIGFGGFVAGHGLQRSVQAGLTLAQIGEFSFVIAGLGAELGAVPKYVVPVATAVAGLTALTTPLLIPRAPKIAAAVHARLPRAWKLSAGLYSDWLDRLRTGHPSSPTRKHLQWLMVDGMAVAAVAVLAVRMGPRWAADLAREFDLAPALTGAIVLVGAVLAVLPFGTGLVRRAEALTSTLTSGPARGVATLVELLVLACLVPPVLALIQPTLPMRGVLILLALMLAGLGLAWQRTAARLQRDMRSGAQGLLRQLAIQARAEEGLVMPADLADLGTPVAVEIQPGTPGDGRTLAELNLRAKTGATVLAVHRPDEGPVLPTGREPLRSGDILALAGTRQAMQAARDLLSGRLEPLTDPNEPLNPTRRRSALLRALRGSGSALVWLMGAVGSSLHGGSVVTYGARRRARKTPKRR